MNNAQSDLDLIQHGQSVSEAIDQSPLVAPHPQYFYHLIQQNQRKQDKKNQQQFILFIGVAFILLSMFIFAFFQLISLFIAIQIFTPLIAIGTLLISHLFSKKGGIKQ